MLKAFILFIVGGLLGTAAGFAIGIFAYPYLFLADIVATEQVVDRQEGEVAATGSFTHVDPNDPIHYGSGGVVVYPDLVHLKEDFEVGPGPKFHVYLVPAGEVTQASQVSGSMFVDLGRLRAFKGSQNYPIPPGVDVTAFGSVVIWCEQFGVLISPATLDFQNAATS